MSTTIVNWKYEPNPITEEEVERDLKLTWSADDRTGYDLPESWGGGRVWARYMGTKGRFSEIPPNPVPGDLWNVTETGASWIYCVLIGYNHAAWIDP
jgi:hypothetical protein